ncbi:hypothetical protein [Saccharibacillus endophyticus]|uniref:SbsC C-terminal domain-containing protein n=1 Tax=Saccharibacillus endophyticus TaxID=2060666 RepID=A0ABQ1ZNY7_9BACL|nr:hypothetical protein [Saccharibacillus endophyticus]GGH72889.1 hypothetical protein GCM10007362_11470 [Saccharibacillus endophyticus]
MEKKPSSHARKWSAAVVATAVLAGGVYAVPHIFADGSPESEAKVAASADKTASTKASPVPNAAASVTTSVSASSTSTAVRTASASVTKIGNAEVYLPVISIDPKKSSVTATRAALIDLEVMTLRAVEHFPLDTSEKAYATLTETRNRAVEVLSDPNAPIDRIYSTSRKLEESLDRYNGEAISNANAVKKVLADAKSKSGNNAAGALVLQGVAEAQNKLSADSTKDGALSAYKQFLLRESEANDITAFRASDYTSVLKQYEANIKARTENVDEDLVEDLRDSFDTSAAALEAILDRTSGKNELDAAQSGVETTYAALNEGLSLAADIKSAEPLLDSPTGKEKGQYAASAVGTLKRAIGKAERALEKSTTAEQVKEASSDLSSAVSEFKSKRNT